MLRPHAIVETVLYSHDLPATVSFYRDALGLAMLRDWTDLGVVFRVGPASVLLIFNPDESRVPGRSVPSHGCDGPGHIALMIDDPDYDAWLAQLAAAGIPIEHEHLWDEPDRTRTGRSIYIRDPAGNSVELITADIWPDLPG